MPSRPLCRCLARVITLASFLGLTLSPHLKAANGTWSSTADGAWSNTANWTSGTIADGAGFTAFFNNVDLTLTNKTITLDSSRVLGGIRIGDSSNSDRRSFTLAPAGTETITLDNGTANAEIIQSMTSNGDTISVPLLLSSSLDIYNMANDRTLTISGSISSNTSGLKTISIVGLSPVNAASSPVSTNLTTGAVTLSGIISDGTAGQVRIVVNGHTGSTLTLSGANTFTGGVTLDSGTLILSNATALGAASGRLTINSGYISATTALNVANPMTWNGSFAYLGASSVDLTLSGSTVTMTRSLEVGVLARQLNVQGVISDGGNAYTLTKSGAGTMYLTGVNTYTGGTRVEGGTLVANKLTSFGGTGANILVKNGATISMNIALTQAFLARVDPSSMGTVGLWGTATPGALDFSALPGMRLGAAATATFSGALTPYGTIYRLGGGGSTLTVSTALSGARSLEYGVRGTSVGNVILSGVNTYTGSTTVLGGGVLQLNGNTGSLADTSNLILAGNGTFRYDNTGATGAIADTVGSLQFQTGDGNVLSARTLDFATTLTVAGISRSAGATGNFNATGTNATVDLNQIVISTPPAAGFLNAGLYVTGANFAAYDGTGAGYVRALAYGTDADTATATTAFINDKHINQTAAISGQASESIRTLRVSGAFDTALATGATLTVSTGGILKAGTGTATISGGAGITTGGNVELVIRADLSTDILNVNTNILATSTGGLTKSGAGTVVLGGTSSYQGTTTVNLGTLRALGAQALGDGEVVLNGGTLDLRANGTQPGVNNGTPEALVFGNNVTIAGDSTIAVNNISGGTIYLNKNIQINNLTIGGNTLNITNSNGYGLEVAGTTTLSVGATGNTILNLGTARTSNLNQALTLNGKVTGTSNITIRGTGTVQLTNATNDFTGDIRVAGGVLAAASNEALGNLANNIKFTESTTGSTFRATGTFGTSRVFTLGNGAASANIFQVNAGQTFTLNSAFLGTSGFTKSDNGTFEINAANTGWDGDVLIQDGIVKISNSAALGTTVGTTQINNLESALHINGGVAGLTLAENFNLYSTGVNSTGAILGLAGAGTNTLSGTITLNGAASIGVQTGGTLNLTSTTGIAGNTDVIANGQVGSSFALTLTGGGSGTLAAPITTGSSTLTKTGTGTWTLTGTSTFSGAVVVNQGTLVLSGTEGKVAAGSAWQLSPGATLVLDNTNGHLDNRLGTRGIHFGGNLTIIGDASAPTVETITGSNLAAANTAAILTLDADPTQSLTFQVSGNFQRSTSGTVLYRGDNLGNTPGAGVATMKAGAVPTYVGQTGAAGTINRGIIPWAIVDQSATGLGTAFATYSTTNGIMALNAVAGEQVAYMAGTANVALTTAKATLGATTVNSLNLGNGGGITTLPLTILTVESGGVLASTGNTGIQGGILQTSSNRDLIVHALGDLQVGAVIANSTGGLTKTGAGTLTLGASNLYTGATTINQGTLKLAGGDNTIFAGQTLNVNFGGTLDLNGNLQTVGLLRSLGSGGNEVPANGGIVTTSAGAATLAVNQTSSGTFAGQITSNVSLVVSGATTLTLTGDNTFSGTTLINGGVVTLNNGGRISGTSAVNLNYASLRVENISPADVSARIADTADISLRGSTLSFYGKPGATSSETLGDVVLEQGASVITAAANTNNGNLMPQAATLTLTSLTRNAAAGATVNFGQSYSGTSSERLGILASSAGSSENIIVTGGLATTNNIIGAWAVYTNYFNRNPIEFVGYDTAGGVGALNAQGFAGYDDVNLPAASQPAQNIRLVGNGSVASGGVTVNTLNFIANATTVAPVITFANDTDVLNLAAGGLAFSYDAGANNAGINGTIGATPNSGRITAGGLVPTGPVDLFVYYQNSTATNAFTLNSAVIDNPNNGGQAVRLIVNSTNFGKFPVVLASNLNSYSGGTIVNNQILQIGVGTTEGNLPAGGLTINGGIVTQVAGTIAAQNVALNGPAALNLNVTTANTTLNAITFDNNGGGTTAPTITLATGVTLNLGGNITATSSNVASTATITGGTLALNGASRTIDVAPIAYGGENLSPDQAGLSIASVISGSNGLVKTGAGILQLSGASTFTGGINLQQGGLVISAASTPTTGTVTSGPLGTGTLTIGNNTTITADGTARTVANAVTVSGDFTLGVRGPAVPGATTTAALTLSGAVAWGSTPHQVTVNSNPATVQTISGAVSGTGAIVKMGIGTVAITGNNSTTLNWTDTGDVKVNEGTLRIAADTSLGAAPASATSGNIVLSGGALGNTATATLNANRGIALGDAAGSGTGMLEAATSTTFTYNGVITNNGTGADNLLKTGAGTLSLGGASTYTGHTTIATGTLTLTTGGSINDSDRITVNTGATFNVNTGYAVRSGQTLEGGGTVNGNVAVASGATLAPGAVENRTADKLTFTNVLTLDAGSTVRLEINAPTFTSADNFGGHLPGTAGYNAYVATNGAGQTNHDLLSAGTLTQNAGAQILVLASAVVPVEGQIYNLIDWATAFNASSNLGDLYRTGANDSSFDLDLPDISGSGLMWDITNFASAGVLVVVVPEPGRCMLLMIALAAFVARRRRR